MRFIRPSAIQIAEYWDWDRAFPVTPTPAGLGFDAALGDAFRDAVRGLLTQAAGGGLICAPAARADTLEVKVGVLRQEHPRETISIVDIPAADDFVAGAISPASLSPQNSVSRTPEMVRPEPRLRVCQN